MGADLFKQKETEETEIFFQPGKVLVALVSFCLKSFLPSASSTIRRAAGAKPMKWLHCPANKGHCLWNPGMRQFICRVDAEDRIAFVDASWVAFAKENGTPALTAESVRGVSLWNYISESVTQEFYRIFMRKVRATGRTIVVPFRCDGPECRRFMEMAIVSLGAGALEFRSALLREEARPRVDLLDPDFPRTEQWLTQCAWCKRVNVAGWMEVEEAVRQLGLFEQARLPRITHSVCPACKQAFESTPQST